MTIETQTQFKAAKNIDLSKEEYEILLSQLKEGNEFLFEKIFTKLFKQNLNLIKRKYQAQQEDAYDCVMWAMLRIRQMLLEGKIEYGNINNYFSRIAVTRYIKTQSRKREFPTEFVPVVAVDDAPVFDQETINVLERAWGKLDDISQQLLKGFYYDKIELKELSVMIGDSSAANTRKRKERSLKKLRRFFFEGGESGQ